MLWFSVATLDDGASFDDVKEIRLLLDECRVLGLDYY
jgi:hypothetical protein